jgi:DNA-binding beta-propeller fold protein YncE
VSVTVDPTGKFVYVACRSSSFISEYKIDQNTGLLSYIDSIATQNNPRSITVDPTGKFVYAANGNSNSISGYTIDQNTGFLTSIGTFPTQNFPTSVITVRIPKNIPKKIKCEPSSASDVPGNSVLCYDPSVPLVNYLPPPRTFLAGGTKWPQSSWQPGDNGFPRGKKGMRMLFQ